MLANRSLHHVGDLDVVLRRIADLLLPGGALVVQEFEAVQRERELLEHGRIDSSAFRYIGRS